MSDNRQLYDGCILSDRYLITETLGEGGFSITYKAVHIDMQKAVAIKEFFHRDYMYRDIRISKNIQLINESDRLLLERDLQSFLEEARILASLSKVEGIVHVNDFFKENETAYIVMELVEGVSLEERLEKGLHFESIDLVRNVLPMVAALGKVHEKGIIHRDIKPDNIIISKDGSFILIDFGAALHIVGEKTHSIYLSEGYAPIEQYLRKAKLDAYTDIYALCAVLYRCITGIIPEHSIQRAVFDELKMPSELGISIPAELEAAICRGMQVEAELRWQTMADLYQALNAVLPIDKRPRRSIYILSGVVAAFIILFSVYGVRHYKELKMNYLRSDGDTITFYLDAPKGMTTSEFGKAASVVEDRLNTFAGENNYYIQKDTSRIIVIIPQKYFNIEENRKEDEILHTLFSFNGKWLLHNADMSEHTELTPEDINSVELDFGTIPVVTTTGEPLFYDGEFIDWQLKEGYFLEIEFKNRVASFLNDFLKEKGYIFMVDTAAETEEDMFPYWWVSKGDGKTVYFFIGSSQDKNIADTFYHILSKESFSNSLELFWQNENVNWEIPANKNGGFYQCAIEDLTSPTVEVLYTINSETDADVEILKDFCNKQLTLLELPYAIGQDDSFIHVRIPYERLNKLVLFSIFGAEITVGTGWGYGYGIESAMLIDDTQHKLEVFLEEDVFDTVMSFANGTEYSDKICLYLDDVKIGIMDSIDNTEKTITFTLLLSDDADVKISSEKMAQYIYNIALNQIQPNIYYNRQIWRDEENHLLGREEIPDIPPGVDFSRFYQIKSAVEELGGTFSYTIDSNIEEIEILFDHWTGNFPEEALKMIETLFRQGKMAENICYSIQFNIHSWYKGEEVDLHVEFCPEEESHTVICLYGRLDSADKNVLERAKKYIENSEIFTSPEDRFHGMDEYNTRDNTSIWEYNLMK